MGFWTDEPITNEATAESIRWGLAIAKKYLEHPSTILPAGVVDAIVRDTQKTVARWEKELDAWDKRKRRG